MNDMQVTSEQIMAMIRYDQMKTAHRPPPLSLGIVANTASCPLPSTLDLRTSSLTASSTVGEVR